MKCPQCQAYIKEGAKFCGKCGSRLSIVCPQCDTENDPENDFCNECGHNLRETREAPPIDFSAPQSYTPRFLAEKILTTRSSIEGERKLVTVLFADVANYTSIAEKLDPEEVHQIMDRCFKILMDEIHRYEGTINQFTGDGVMALFGAPVAHEDHAQRACHAALSIQGAMERYSNQLKSDHGIDFKLRIGLNSGHVVVGSIGDDLRMDYTAIGDTTNLASRMENMAKPGQSAVSSNTYKLTKNFFHFKALGKVKVKGKKESLEAYELIKAGEVETRIEAAAVKGLTKFVGRRKEISALKEAFDKVRSKSGQVVGIVGEAGVGKSRLLLEFRGMLPRDEYTYLEGRGLHYGGSMAYLPILDILRSYFRISEDDKELGIKVKLKEKILKLDERLKSALPPFHELFSLEIEDQYYVHNEPQERKQKVFEAIRDVLVLESRNRPVVVAVEDLQWIDRTSQEFLDYVVEWLPNTAILLILLYRPEYTHQWGSKSYYGKIGLDQLSTKTSAELVQSILEGGELVPELRELILSRTGGNPLFMEEFTHSLLENGSIERRDKQFVLSRKIANIQIPDTIEGIIAARIDRIEESLKRVMQVASVIGRDFAYRILQSITGMREELKSHLLNLQGLEFIYEKSLFPELEYIFKHAITQEVAYNSLLLKRRKEIHEKIGSAIEALYPERLEEYYELLAYHYLRSDEKDKAVEYLDLANQKAGRMCAMEDAKNFFDRAMNMLDQLPENEANRKRRISLLLNQRTVFLLLLKTPEYYEMLSLYKPLAEELGFQELLGAFYSSLAHCEWYMGHLDQALQTGTRAADLCESSGNTEGLGFAYLGLQFTHLLRGDYEQSFSFQNEVLRLMEQRFNPYIFTRALAAGSWACSAVGRWDEAVREGLRALKTAEEASVTTMISFAQWIISMAYTYKGNLPKAIKYGKRAVESASTPADKTWAQAALAWAWCRAGEREKGIELLNMTLTVSRAGGFKPSELCYSGWLGEGYLLDGDLEKATQMITDSLQLSERCGMRFFIGWAQRILGEIALKKNSGEAPSLFQSSIKVLQEIGAENELALAYAGYGRFCKQQGDPENARKYLTKALENLERLGTPIEPEKVREDLAGLSVS